jgi:putative transposase
MRLRYSFRLYPDRAQRDALARAFGCARVVFNDAVRAREDARAAGGPFPKAGELSTRLITRAKQTEARSWLGEVSAVVLQRRRGSSPVRMRGSRSGSRPTPAGQSPAAGD